MINKAVFSMGAMLALLAFGGIYFLGQVIAPPPVLVMAAREDLAPGTALAQIPESSLVEVPLRGDATLLSSLVTQAEYAQMRAAGAMLVEGIMAREPLRKAALVAAGNDGAGRMPARALADPSLMIVRLAVGDSAPLVRAGDLVDLGLAVRDLQAPAPASAILSAPPVNTSGLFLPPGMSSELPGPSATPTASPTPTQTATPSFLAPMAKTIVHAAVVTHVVRAQPPGGATAPGGSETRAILAIDVIIPRAAFEMVTMANAAGQLQVGLLSPLAERSQGPTLGASLSDFITWFYADREQLHPDGANPMAGAARTPAPAHTPDSLSPTATP